MDVYHKLREKLNTYPIGVPDRPQIYEILHTLFTPEEAELALNMPPTPKPVDYIAKKAGLAITEVITICERLADKGLVLSHIRDDQKYYMLLPIAPGAFEYTFMGHKHLNLDFSRLRTLWNEYYHNGWGHEVHGGNTSTSRIIPVQKSISSTSLALPFEEVSHYIGKADKIAVGDCACRVLWQRCNNPIETCIWLDSTARFLVERKMARYITRGEAIKIIEACEEAGLVHLSSNCSAIEAICNCCSCCCGMLGSITRLKDTSSHPVSNFYASVNAEDCNACGVCEDRCPTKAITIDMVAGINTLLCIGCGLCASACPIDAIQLTRRADSAEPPPAVKDLGFKLAEEKGRLQALIANQKGQ